jgi:hypothetical protein
MQRSKPKRLERARLLIEQAEALGEPLEDPLLLLSVLYGAWVSSYIAFKGDVCRDYAAHVWALANTQAATIPLLLAHSIKGVNLSLYGRLPRE